MRGIRIRSKNLVGAALATAVALDGAFVGAEAATYSNARYGYEVTYPADLLVAEPVAGDGDGRRFHSRDGRASFLLFGQYNVLDDTPASIAKTAEKDCHGAAPVYLMVKPALVALSCRTGATIVYWKTIIRAEGETSFSATYPAAEQAR